MSRERARTFTRAFKLKAIERMDSGENVSALSRELTVRTETLYHWRTLYRSGGEARLREGPGRPSLADTGVLAVTVEPSKPVTSLAQARRRIDELECKLDQQQAALDYFKEAVERMALDLAKAKDERAAGKS